MERTVYTTAAAIVTMVPRVTESRVSVRYLKMSHAVHPDGAGRLVKFVSMFGYNVNTYICVKMLKKF